MKKQVVKAASALEKDVFSEVAKDGAHYREIHRKYVEASLDPQYSETERKAYCETAEKYSEARGTRNLKNFGGVLLFGSLAAGIAIGCKCLFDS